MENNKTNINCLIFKKQNSEIKILKDKINAAKKIHDKVPYAIELQKEADVLLNCSDYALDELDCKNCHLIANLFKKTANLIIKTEKLK